MLAALLLAASASVSCEEMKSDNETPVVRYVRPVDPEIGDQMLTEVSMGATVAVIGEGFSGVSEIYFNDIRVRLNPAYVTPTSIILTVPSEKPEEITDMMYLKTSKGKEASFGIKVRIPSPHIESMECQYAPAGQELSIYGNYFFSETEDGSDVSVTFPGNVKADVVSVEDEEIVIKVPDGAETEGNITVTSPYGTSRSSFNWRSTEGLFLDFEETDSWNGWNRGAFGPDAENGYNDSGCSGRYMYYANPAIGNWSWQPILYFINRAGVPLVSEGNPEDYALVFECQAKKWDAVAMKIWFENNGSEGEDIGESAVCLWMLGKADVDGRWKTITIPLTDFNSNGETGDSYKSASIKSLDELVNFHIVHHGACEDGGEMDIKFDNFRLVKIK